MSSFVRTLQKRMLKRMGYHRQNRVVEEFAGSVVVRRLPRGSGPIVNGDGERVGIGEGNTRWPLSRPVVEEKNTDD